MDEIDKVIAGLTKAQRGEKRGEQISPTDRLLALLLCELECSDMQAPSALHITDLARKGIETKNLHYIDAAFLACRNAGFAPPQTLLKLMEDVAEIRLAGHERGGDCGGRNAASMG